MSSNIFKVGEKVSVRSHGWGIPLEGHITAVNNEFEEAYIIAFSAEDSNKNGTYHVSWISKA